jgi:hypothetical protein
VADRPGEGFAFFYQEIRFGNRSTLKIKSKNGNLPAASIRNLGGKSS